MCGGGGTQVRKADAEVKVANEDPSKAKFTTKHGSQGVTNPDYAAYVRKHPDLMANYNKRWKKGAPDPLSQNNAGISLAEYGAMHYAKYGRKEGRAFPGKSGGGGGGGGGGGDPDGGILGPYPEPNIYFPMLDTAYTAPNAQDWSAYMPAGSPFTGGAQARYPQAVFPPEWGTDTPYANSSNPLFNQGPPPEPAGGMPYYDIPGLLYQPWSTEYQQAFVPGNLWNYVPPELNVGAPQYRSHGGHMSVGGGGGGGGAPPEKKGPWWETDPHDGAEPLGGMGNLGNVPGPFNEKWTTLEDGTPVRRGWGWDDDGKLRTFADIARDEAAKAGKTAAAIAASIADVKGT